MKEKAAGMEIPGEIVERLKGAEERKSQGRGIEICVEQIQRLWEIKGVHGIHHMAIEWERVVHEIVERARLLPRPQVD